MDLIRQPTVASQVDHFLSVEWIPFCAARHDTKSETNRRI
jgi:hypothetical protein